MNKECKNKLVTVKNKYDWVSNVYCDGFKKVKKNEKYNFIDKQNKILSNIWFDKIYNFKNGFARVKLNHLYNYLKINGKLLLNEWVELLHYFDNGYSKVSKNNKWNLLDVNGIFLLNNWVDEVSSFSNGYASIKLNGKQNYVDFNGKLLFKFWFESVYGYNFYNEHAIVISKKTNKCNFINKQGIYILNKWYSELGEYNEKYIPVKIKGKGYNFIDINENILFDRWYDGVCGFQDGLARVYYNNKYNYINTKGKLISNKWFDFVLREESTRSHIMLDLNNKSNLMDIHGNFLCSIWYDHIYPWYWYGTTNYIIVKLNEKYNIINILTNNYLFNFWFDGYTRVEDESLDTYRKDMINIKIKNNYYILNFNNGNIIHIKNNINING